MVTSLGISIYHFHREGGWVAEGYSRIEIISIHFGRQKIHTGDIEGPVAVHEFCPEVKPYSL